MLKEAVGRKLAGPFEVLDCSGMRALYSCRDALVHIATATQGGPVQRTLIPLPPGRVVAGSAADVSVVVENGDLWTWNSIAEVWQRVGNPREGA
jgi:hypothetical protein